MPLTMPQPNRNALAPSLRLVLGALVFFATLAPSAQALAMEDPHTAPPIPTARPPARAPSPPLPTARPGTTTPAPRPETPAAEAIPSSSGFTWSQAIQACINRVQPLWMACSEQVTVAKNGGYCSMDKDSGVSSMVGQGAMLANAFQSGTSEGCGQVATFSASLNAAVAAFKTGCNNWVSSCLEPCREVQRLVDTTDGCRYPPGGPTTETELSAALDATLTLHMKLRELDDWADKASAGEEECAKSAANGNEVGGNVAQALATLKNQTTTCKMNTASAAGAPDYCTQNPTDPSCQSSGSGNCSDPANANSTVCKCFLNPASCANPAGAGFANGGGGIRGGIGGGGGGGGGIKGADALGASGPSLKLDPLGGGPGFGSAGFGGPVPGGGPRQQGQKVGGAKGGSAPSGGGGGGEAPPAGRTGGGGAPLDDNQSLYKGSGRGGAPGAAGAAYAGAYRNNAGGGGAGGNIYNGRVRRNQGAPGPNLNDFLPGGRQDPQARALAGITGPDGITGPHTNLFSKVKNRYQALRPSLLQN